MEEDTRGNQTNSWDDKKNNCIINIFCDDKKHDGHCIINIFCNDKKSDDKCNDEKDW